jgi:hypothetical protein
MAQCAWDTVITVVFWINPRYIELPYTSWDLEVFAKDCGYEGPPFRWDEDRRFLLRCELDAAFFHLYGIERDDVDYIMETFPIVKRKDVKQYGSYRTKEMILDIYDDMSRAIASGEPYQTRLDPPAADPSVAHPESTRPEWAPVPEKRLPELPRLPDVIPINPDRDRFHIIWAFLYANGGTITRSHLTRAFTMWSEPGLLLKKAPESIRAKVAAWVDLVQQRSLPPEAMDALDDLAIRGVIRLTTDESGRAVVKTNDSTPAEERIAKHYRDEALFILRALEEEPEAISKEEVDAMRDQADDLAKAQGA